MQRKLLLSLLLIISTITLRAQHYGTYFGGNVNELAEGLLVDLNANVYLVGSTSSPSGVATLNGFDTSFGGGSSGIYDVYVAKFNAKGVLEWATYLGGSNLDYGFDVCFDKDSNLLVTGSSQSSTGIATADAQQPNLNGNTDGFIVKYSRSGSLLYASYLGLSGTEILYDIAIDKMGYVYIVGQADATDILPFPGIQQSVNKGGTDLFLVKLSPDLKTIIKETYFGSNLGETSNCILIDDSYNVYLGGYTGSSSGIATTGAYQTTHGGSNDMFLCKFDSNFVLLTATYLGGNLTDYVYDMLWSHSGDIFFCGTSNSASGIVLPGAWQSTNAGLYDAVLGAFDKNLQLKWNTYMGGNSVDMMTGICIDDYDTIYVMGHATSQSGITTPGAYRETYNGGAYDAFFQQFSPSGQRMWSSYLGGSGQETGRNAVYGADKNLYVLGTSYSDTGIATAGANQVTRNGVIDAFYFKYEMTHPVINNCATPIDAGFTVNRMIQCTRDNEFIFTDTLTSNGSITHYWDFGNGTYGSNPTETVHYDPLVNNQITVRLVTTVDGVCTDSALKTIYLVSSPEKAVITGNTPVYMGSRQTYSVPFHNGSTYQWFFESGSGSSINASIQIKWLMPDTVDLKVVETNGGGCVGDTGYLQVIIKDPTGTEEWFMQQVPVYPNPASDAVYLGITGADKFMATLFDMQGRKLFTVHPETDGRIALGTQPAGIYMLQLTDESGNEYHVKLTLEP